MKFSGLHKQRLSVEKGGMRQNARRLAADEEKCEREDITLEKREGFFERFFGISQSGSNAHRGFGRDHHLYHGGVYPDPESSDPG